MSSAPRRIATLSLLAGAVAFGMVLAGALDLSPVGLAAPCRPHSANHSNMGVELVLSRGPTQ